MEEMVTVIVPVYNGQRHIEHMINMLKAQTYKNIEVIIVNDGSTDDTAKLCIQYIGEDTMFKLLSKDNGGVSTARNYGVEHAAGQYITFVDVDDYIYPEYVEKLYYLISKYNADWAQCSFIKVTDTYYEGKYEKYRKDISLKNDEGELVLDHESAIFDFGYRRHLGGYPYLKLIKRDLADKVSFRTDLKYGEDYTYVYELLKLSQRVAYIDSIEYLYVQQSDSETHRTKDRTQDYYKTWKQLNHIYQEVQELFPDAAGGFLEKCYMQAIKDTSRIKDKRKYQDYSKELYRFIRKNGTKVFADRNNKLFHKLLGLAGSVSPQLTCGISAILFSYGFSLRRVS